MRHLILCAGLVLAAPGPASASLPDLDPRITQTTAHGGGCRKSSPAGQCCHMEKKVGKVHCH